MNKAFQVEITEQRHRLAKQIFFDIKELSDEDIQRYLEQYPDFKKGDNNIELTNDEAVYKLKNYLSVTFYINSNINILNPDAYEIISIKN